MCCLPRKTNSWSFTFSFYQENLYKIILKIAEIIIFGYLTIIGSLKEYKEFLISKNLISKLEDIKENKSYIQKKLQLKVYFFVIKKNRSDFSINGNFQW